MPRKISKSNYNTALAKSREMFKPLPAGGYVCKIVDAEFGENKSGDDVLILRIDIAEGEFANFFRNQKEHFNNDNWAYAATVTRKIFDENGDVKPSFATLIDIIEKSNPGFDAYGNSDDEIDETALIGKSVGYIFGEYEYKRKDGEIGTNTKAKFVATVDNVRNGKFKIPPCEKLDEKQSEKTQDDTPQDFNYDRADLENPPF